MSQTYVIACHQCRTALWVGQGNNGATFEQNGYLYSTPSALNGLASFMANHQGHPLEFNHDAAGALDCYEVMDADGEVIQDKIT